jgi:hypothetical protein
MLSLVSSRIRCRSFLYTKWINAFESLVRRTEAAGAKEVVGVLPMTKTFDDFFRSATSGRDPYPYQEQFADADPLPHLLRAPTGAGKTATAVLGWLWRWVSKKPGTPRRLVYCLPMRVLVEQSEREARKWTQALLEKGVLEKEVGVHVRPPQLHREGAG